MLPSPGKIHSLPVKVSYTVDNSAQAYFTVLPERQRVFVHATSNRIAQNGGTLGEAGPSTRRGSGAAGGGDDQPQFGSCGLKGVVWGVCYASPECVPSPAQHDFSVYALDPASRNSPSQSRPFSSSSLTDTSHREALASGQDRWDGKGFLSWSLHEPDPGSTLVRGRIVRDPDFAGVGWNPEGGLEGLMALEASGAGNGESTEGDDGGGGEAGPWGLEVSLSLKMVRLAGRAIGDKREFGEMIARARNAGAPSAATAVMRVESPFGGSAGDVSTPDIVPPPRSMSATGAGPRRIEPRLIAQPTNSASSWSNGALAQEAGPSAAPARTSSSVPSALPVSGSDTATTRALLPNGPSWRNNTASSTVHRPTALPHRPSSATSSSFPASSLPMAASTSHQGSTAVPSSRPPSALDHRSSSIPPAHTSSSGPVPPSSSSAATAIVEPSSMPPSKTTHAPNADKDESKIRPTSASGRVEPSSEDQRDRETTPPPVPRPKSPPPSTPARLQALLRSDAKLSPGLAKSLASNPALLKLLKSIPASSGALATLRSPFGGSTNTADPSQLYGPPPRPPAFHDISPTKQKPSPATSASAASDFPTPKAATAHGQGGPSKPATQSARAQATAEPTGSQERRCDNCGTTQSGTWRTRKTKEGGQMKVCDECGLYFNKHKKMRPADVWAAAPGGGSTRQSTTVLPQNHTQVNVTEGGAGHALSQSGSQGTKRKNEQLHGVRSSPRRVSQRHDAEQTNTNGHGHGHATRNSLHGSNVGTVAAAAADMTRAEGSGSGSAPAGAGSGALDSPRKRKKGAPPPPSPRRNTRAAAKELQESGGGVGVGAGLTSTTQLSQLQDDARVSPSPDARRNAAKPVSIAQAEKAIGEGQRKVETFSPSTFFHTSPMERALSSHGNGESTLAASAPAQGQTQTQIDTRQHTNIPDGNRGDAAGPPVDIEALLAQFAASTGHAILPNGTLGAHGQGANGAGDGDGGDAGGEGMADHGELLDLDKWFAENGIDVSEMEGDDVWGGGDWAGLLDATGGGSGPNTAM